MDVKERALQAHEKWGGKIEVVAVHKLGCDKKDGAYACTIQVETKLPVVGSQRKTQQVIIADGPEGWVLVE